MVIRVNSDGSLMPFEILPELFLGRPIRQLLVSDVRDQFLSVCREVVADLAVRSFVPEGFDENNQVMITPVLDSSRTRCQFLVCWSRRQDDGDVPVGIDTVCWGDLDPGDVEVRFRAYDDGQIEAAPWWAVGDDGVELWSYPEQVAAIGLGQTVMATVISDGVACLMDNDAVRLRLDVPGAEMLDGLLQVFYGAIRTSGVDAARIEVGIPVELAVDPDLLPLIAHLRTLGLQIDIVGLDALTARLYRVSDTSDHHHVIPRAEAKKRGSWTANPIAAIEAA